MAGIESCRTQERNNDNIDNKRKQRIDYLIKKGKDFIRGSKENGGKKDYSDWQHDVSESEDLGKYEKALELMMNIDCIVKSEYNEKQIIARCNTDSSQFNEIYENYFGELFLAEKKKFFAEKHKCDYGTFCEILNIIISYYKDNKIAEIFEKAFLSSFSSEELIKKGPDFIDQQFETEELIKKGLDFIKKPRKLSEKEKRQKKYDILQKEKLQELDSSDWVDMIHFLKRSCSPDLRQYQEAYYIMRDLRHYNSVLSSSSNVRSATNNAVSGAISDKSGTNDENFVPNSKMKNYVNRIKNSVTETYMRTYGDERKSKLDQLIELVVNLYIDENVANAFKNEFYSEQNNEEGSK